jgi:hypothetical protein
MGNDLRDRVLEHARHRHGDQLARRIREELSRSDLAALDANAYLALLGHLRFSGFDEQILDIWDRHQDQALSYGVWAAARCPLRDVARVLVSLDRKPARNSDRMLGIPLSHFAVGPSPLEWVGVEPVVLVP